MNSTGVALQDRHVHVHEHFDRGHDHEGEHLRGRLGECGHDHSETGLKWRLTLVLLGGVCLILSGVLRWLRPDQADLAVTWSMLGAIITALPIFRDALLGFRSKAFANTEFYMNQFITLAVIACFVTQQYVVGGVVAIILLVGHILEDRSMLGTNEAINSLLHLSRVTARRVRNGVEEEVDAESLGEDDLVRVRPGDTMPADGLVLNGFSTVNQATITGESLPVEVETGATVFAGTSNLTGLIEIKVTKTGTQTVLGRVKEIVEEAQQTRAPIVRLTEEYARYYMPLILLIAGFVLFFTKDVQRAISVIVVSIPCTFVLAGPSAMVAALAAASRMGILVKSVRFFEVANDIDTVVFDKTGTLTTGELKVAAIAPSDGMAENELLALIAAVEQHSTHPIARAVVTAAQDRQLEIGEAEDVQEEHGHGLLARVGPLDVVVGRRAWLEAQAIPIPKRDKSFDDLSALHIGVNRKLAGIIYLSDTVRAEAKGVSADLRKGGVDHLMMLTGDRRTVAESIAEHVGMTEFEADCLPEQKQDVVRKLKTDGRKVMVVGDGVNDAPALAAGDLSVAMGALGSDVAIQTADIALMASDLRRVPHFLALSDKTLRIINQNMLCGFVFIAAAIVLSGVGLIPPIAAAFVHEFGAFFVIFNSARLLRFEGKAHEVANYRSMNKTGFILCLLAAPVFTVRAADKVRVASFSTIDTEIVQQVGDDHVAVAALVKPGVDPHEYEPTPGDLRKVSDAQLILTSGKHMENYLNKLQEATGGKADLLKVGDHFSSLTMKQNEAEDGEDNPGMIEDPHWWHSVANVKQATRIIRAELSKLDPADKADFDKSADAYLAKLDALDNWVRRKVAELPRDKRKLVTSHDAFQYFARDYGFKIEAIEGVNTETEASNRHVSELIDDIKKQGVKAIFLESTLNPKVTTQITRETGVKIGGTLYADGLGPGDASTYEGMMKHNVSTIVDALK